MAVFYDRLSSHDASKGWLCRWEVPGENEYVLYSSVVSMYMTYIMFMTRPLGIIGRPISEYDPQSLKPLLKSQVQEQSASEMNDSEESNQDLQQ